MKVFENHFLSRPLPFEWSGANSPVLAQYILELFHTQELGSHAQDQNIVVILKDSVSIDVLATDLESLSKKFENKTTPILKFYAWQKNPYISSILPTPVFQKDRLRNLIKLVTNKSPTIVLAHPNALMLKSLPPEEFKKFAFSLNLNQTITPFDLKKQLMALGYEQREVVTDPGTFSQRGDLCDFYPLDFENPVRIDFFDDFIERIRFFNTETQLTLREFAPSDPPLQIYPAKECLLIPETISYLKKNLKNFCDEYHFSKKIRDDIFEKISLGIYPETAVFWSSFLYAKTVPTSAFLPKNRKLIFYEMDSIQTQLTEQKENEIDHFNHSIQAGQLIPPSQNLFSNLETFIHESRFHSINVEKLNLTTPMSGQKETITLFPITSHPPELIQDTLTWIEKSFTIFIFCETDSELEKIKYLFEGHKVSKNQIFYFQGPLSEGFEWPEKKLVFLTTENFFKNKKFKDRSHKKNLSNSADAASRMLSFAELSEGDAIVHVLHGIGIYRGLKRLSMNQVTTDYLSLEYQGGDRLYLPVDKMNLVQKYSQGDEGVRLNKLGTSHFDQTKKKVRKALKEIAFSLVKLYAQRQASQGPVIKIDPQDFAEFESHFPYQETPDQIRTIEDILKDFRSGRIMDRLVCGDVGFGKTEIALRTSFLAVHSGFQVVVLVPTTILCFQHEKTFLERFKNTGITVASISRFKNKKEQVDVIQKVKEGKIDILIGTHRVLSKDIHFKNLGLLVVDEEHRFGVEHKEKLKNIKKNTHSLTLTATPIPRTLQMALTGIRDLSIIQTPPKERLPTQTFIMRFSYPAIQEAIESELKRDGQVIFLHNKVQSIYKIAEEIRERHPQAKIDVAHGQMNEKELEKKILSFFKRETHILVCTTIIESGMDIPSANTIIINRADTLGLSQLYQIRGRVGRGDRRAYAYLMIPERGQLSLIAQQRLEVIQKYVDLGSGFKVATHDLDQRGGGNLIGAEQSGHIDSVGIELYLDLLKEAVSEIKGEPEASSDEKRSDPEIKVPFPAYLDESYLLDIQLRLNTYKRLSKCENENELDAIENELQDRFGKIPYEGLNLLWVLRIKLLLKKHQIAILLASKDRLSLMPEKTSQTITPELALKAISLRPETYHLTPDSQFIIHAQNPDVKSIYHTLLEHLNLLPTLKPC